MKTKGFFTKLRHWLDGVSTVDHLKEISQPVKTRKSENLMANIATRIDSILQNELFILPNGEAQIPPKFVVFLNPIDDQMWRNSERLLLEKVLSDLTYERATELCKADSLSVSEIKVILKVDNQLNKNMFQVVATWDETEQPEQPEQKVEKTVIDSYLHNPKKIVQFYVNVWKNGIHKCEIPIYKNMAIIGRGSFSSNIDIPLKGSSQINQIQATLILDNENRFWVFAQDVNPISIEGKIIESGKRDYVLPLQSIKIADFDLRVSFTSTNKTPNNSFLSKRNIGERIAEKIQPKISTKKAPTLV